jgi:hydroxyacylglutathione hydrolase
VSGAAVRDVSAAVSVHPVRALKDNYAYVIVDESTRRAAVVDPSEAAPVEAELARLGVTLVAIWNTHHHWDHVGGNEELIARHGVGEVVGSAYDREQKRIAGQTRGVAPDEAFRFGDLAVETLSIPAHTLGHVAYRIGPHVFPGDTLFGGGCGRLFEGTPAQMVAALGRLRALPDDTQVWCGHEYTLHNMKFAVGIEPGNAATAARLARVAAMAEPRRTVPLSLAEERATNVMMRWDAEAIRTWAGGGGDVEVFAAVRRAKDVWREP